MRRALYFGLIAIFVCALAFGFMIVNYEAYGIGDSFKEISEIASIYDLNHVLCALDMHCEIN